MFFPDMVISSSNVAFKNRPDTLDPISRSKDEFRVVASLMDVAEELIYTLVTCGTIRVDR